MVLSKKDMTQSGLIVRSANCPNHSSKIFQKCQDFLSAMPSMLVAKPGHSFAISVKFLLPPTERRIADTPLFTARLTFVFLLVGITE